MGNPFHGQTVPRGALLGAGLLIGLTVLSAGTARWTGLGTTQLPPAEQVAAAELRFLDRDDGAVVVQAADDGEVIAVLPPGTHGFARGVLRGLARERRLQHLDSGPPFRLVRWSDGRLSLDDPATRRRIALEAFGPTNARVFADLLNLAQTAPAQETLSWKQP